jgi:hypothetical protein
MEPHTNPPLVLAEVLKNATEVYKSILNFFYPGIGVFVL